ncbi:MAG: glutathione-disulfide reductase [Alphaproteobacteria bacterium]|nr:glutathione-disulfide reductase [Alphaproteobacteria bacterium]
MPKFDYDLITLGAGSAGVRASRVAARYGARVAVVEERYLGGTCVNVGCVPKKLFVYAAHFGEDFDDAAGFGWTVGGRDFAWPRLIENKNAEIARLNGVYRDLLEGAGARILDGHARLLDAHTVAVGETTYSAERILVATGGWPAVPEFAGREHVITSNEAFFLDSLPGTIVIVGGGYVAVEFAGIFHGLGARVTQLYRGPLFLRGFDDDVRQALAREMGKKGIDVRFDSSVESIERRDTDDGPRFTVTLADGGAIEAGLVMYATGRRPNTEGFGLEDAGVALNEKGAIVVDEDWRTSVPNIHAIGDVTDRINLTPVAVAEGQALADLLFNPSGRSVGYDGVPSAVFSQPPVGTVGLTEAEARARYGAVDVYRSTFRPLKHTLSGRDEQAMMKLVVDSRSDRVLGVHMVGPEAGEIIQGIAVALKCGATKAHFDATIGIHPTTAEEFVLMREKAPQPAPAG